MERILRSIIQVGGVPDSEDANQNWLRIQEYELRFSHDEDRKIFDYVSKFHSQFQAPPDITLVSEYFQKLDDTDSVSRLDIIKGAQSYIKSNFLSIVRAEQEQQQQKNFIIACNEASHIAQHGKNLDKPINGKKVLRGVHDAVSYLSDKMADFNRVETGEKLEGFVYEEADEHVEEYDKLVKAGTLANRNLFGLEPVDAVCEGHRTGEYWVHCAFTSHLKTTLALNYAYNNSYLYGRNIFYITTEMDYPRLRNQLTTIHSSHGKFVTQWYRDDIKAGRPKPYLGLEYKKVRDGKLDELEYKRFRLIKQDMKAHAKGVVKVWKPAELVSMSDIKRKAEIFHNKYSCHGIVIDYLGTNTVKPSTKYTDVVSNLNSVVSDGRRICQGFARGKGTAVLVLFQMNRQGVLRADKQDGRYDFAAISYANQIEKDADIITYTYLNDALRSKGQFYMGNLKNRENQLFERMIGKIIWESKRMRAIEPNVIEMTDLRIQQASDFVMKTADLIT